MLGGGGKGFCNDFFGCSFVFVWFVGGLGWDVGNGVCSCWFELRDFWFVGR